MDGDLTKMMLHVYDISRIQLKTRGKLGRQFFINEGKFNASDMCNDMITHINTCIREFKPIKNIKLVNIYKNKRDILKNKGIYNRQLKIWE